MSTEYNLQINVLKNQKLVLEKEVANLILQRDKIYNEIADQRNGCGIVVKEKVENEAKKYTILKDLEVIEKDLLKSRDDFVNSYEKQLHTLNKIEGNIEEKSNMIKQLEGVGQTYIEFYNKTINIKQEYKQHQIETDAMTQEAKREQELVKQERQQLEIEKQKFTEEYEYIQTSRRALEKKEKQLKTYEERLNDLKLALNETNNG